MWMNYLRINQWKWSATEVAWKSRCLRISLERSLLVFLRSAGTMSVRKQVFRMLGGDCYRGFPMRRRRCLLPGICISFGIKVQRYSLNAPRRISYSNWLRASEWIKVSFKMCLERTVEACLPWQEIEARTSITFAAHGCTLIHLFRNELDVGNQTTHHTSQQFVQQCKIHTVTGLQHRL